MNKCRCKKVGWQTSNARNITEQGKYQHQSADERKNLEEALLRQYEIIYDPDRRHRLRWLGAAFADGSSSGCSSINISDPRRAVSSIEFNVTTAADVPGEGKRHTRMDHCSVSSLLLGLPPWCWRRFTTVIQNTANRLPSSMLSLVADRPTVMRVAPRINASHMVVILACACSV